MTEYQSIFPQVISILEREMPYLQTKFGIKQLRLFGSVSRGTDSINSDIDLLYIFDEDKATYDNLFDLHEYLTKLFNRRVELVSEKWSGERFLQSALKDSVNIISSSTSEQGFA